MAAKQCHPLTHAGEAQALARTTPVGDLLRVEAGLPISHLQANGVVKAPQCDPHPGGGSMLVDVGEGLLYDSEERCLDLGWQALVPQRFLVVDLGALVADLLDLQTDGGRKPEIVERGRPQICYDVPGLTDSLCTSCRARARSLRPLSEVGGCCLANACRSWWAPAAVCTRPSCTS